MRANLPKYLPYIFSYTVFTFLHFLPFSNSAIHHKYFRHYRKLKLEVGKSGKWDFIKEFRLQELRSRSRGWPTAAWINVSKWWQIPGFSLGANISWEKLEKILEVTLVRQLTAKSNHEFVKIIIHVIKY